jgi:flagellar hook-associated protein FlgK
MRKIFTTLKSVVAGTLVAAMALSVSCSYDDTGIKNEMEQIKNDLATLTERVDALEDKLDEQVAGLTELINGKVVVTDVETNGDVTTVTLSDGSSFVIDNSKSTAVAGDDYTIGAYADGGVYNWAVFKNGTFKKLLEVDGQKVAVFPSEGE